METVTIPKEKYEQMVQEIEILREGKLYRRLLEFENNIKQGKKFTRKDLGFQEFSISYFQKQKKFINVEIVIK